jgi:hypothetical protein
MDLFDTALIARIADNPYAFLGGPSLSSMQAFCSGYEQCSRHQELLQFDEFRGWLAVRYGLSTSLDPWQMAWCSADTDHAGFTSFLTNFSEARSEYASLLSARPLVVCEALEMHLSDIIQAVRVGPGMYTSRSVTRLRAFLDGCQCAMVESGKSELIDLDLAEFEVWLRERLDFVGAFRWERILLGMNYMSEDSAFEAALQELELFLSLQRPASDSQLSSSV